MTRSLGASFKTRSKEARSDGSNFDIGIMPYAVKLAMVRKPQCG
jgi:hypothetical protein